MKQFVCPSNAASSGSPARYLVTFRATTSPSKWATEPALDAGMSAASPITNTFGRTLDCRVCWSVGHEAELVAQAGRALDVGLAAVQRDHDRQVERDLAAVEGDQPPARAVDLAGVELGDEADALVLEQPAELAVAHGLGERPVERGDVGQVDLVRGCRARGSTRRPGSRTPAARPGT